jgi:putative ABC transport system substrate-binding protein
VIERRAFISSITLGLLAAPLAAEAQPAGKVWQIGLLDYSAPDPARQEWWNAFRHQMRELGYVEGENVRFEQRWAEGEDDRLPELASGLVGLKVDLIVTGGTNSAVAAKRATSNIPIVTATLADPVATGVAASLGSPQGCAVVERYRRLSRYHPKRTSRPREAAGFGLFVDQTFPAALR